MDAAQALTMDAPLSSIGQVVGTVPYMATELLRGRPADARSDIWALGVLIYEMVTGGRPFRGSTRYELGAAILSEPPIPLPRELPAPLRHVIARCLTKNPADRYPCASELAAAGPTVWLMRRYMIRLASGVTSGSAQP